MMSKYLKLCKRELKGLMTALGQVSVEHALYKRLTVKSVGVYRSQPVSILGYLFMACQVNRKFLCVMCFKKNI